MKTFRLNRSGRLYTTSAYVKGEKGQIIFSLLLDTGASFTLLSGNALEKLGYEIHSGKTRYPIVTVNDKLTVPRISLQKFSCLGCTLEPFKVLAHDLPSSARIDGLLGMDFLTMFDFTINTRQGIVTVR
ncbi:MAG: retropepsin-like domain-containing protein [Ignavibacteriae bacterium]|nr:retropepsin-like domain-containing protein [Ignavibacteriota bacterium]